MLFMDKMVCHLEAEISNLKENLHKNEKALEGLKLVSEKSNGEAKPLAEKIVEYFLGNSSLSHDIIDLLWSYCNYCNMSPELKAVSGLIEKNSAPPSLNNIHNKVKFISLNENILTLEWIGEEEDKKERFREYLQKFLAENSIEKWTVVLSNEQPTAANFEKLESTLKSLEEQELDEKEKKNV